MSDLTVEEKMLINLLRENNLEPQLIFTAVYEGIAEGQKRETK
tara:strand:+ start:1119 stop:1247 length:129 start_codon:yes stop_codon:yes gene_type:complete